MSTPRSPYPDPSSLPTLDAGCYFDTARGVAGLPVASADASAGVLITDAPESGKKIVLLDVLISVAAANVITLKDADGIVIRGPLYMGGNSTLQLTLRGRTKLPVADKALVLFAGNAGNVSAEATYYSEG